MLGLCEKMPGWFNNRKYTIYHINGAKEKNNYMISPRVAKKHLMMFNTYL